MDRSQPKFVQNFGIFLPMSTVTLLLVKPGFCFPTCAEFHECHCLHKGLDEAFTMLFYNCEKTVQVNTGELSGGETHSSLPTQLCGWISRVAEHLI